MNLDLSNKAAAFIRALVEQGRFKEGRVCFHLACILFESKRNSPFCREAFAEQCGLTVQEAA